MAWKVGAFAVAGGTSVRLTFNWQGQYHGTQFALARPILDLGPWVGQVIGEREIETTNHRLMGRRSDNVEPDWIYGVTVTNPNPDHAVIFELTGGEVEPDA
jgi:hypothetical protein